ncbi:MAG: bifunctional diaminohydroxyphosphoribosylaminopyrimidine deaminase/5-amino-6-(5-phosphoribosylamino)uracil reductase RibD [Planctomycetota bacterium]
MQNGETGLDSKWMRLALDLAKQGQGFVEPNPMVGCVLVDANGAEIGRGYHERYGEPHAERNALANCTASERLGGATAYVSLEPCCHHGKTPPCVDALLEAKLQRVVIGCLDPNPLVAGKGAEALRESGIEVDVGCLEAESQRLIAPFRKRQSSGLPWVIAKWAMTLDGKIATKTHQSKWISGQVSRATVQQLRSRVDAIMVGSGTALSDNPRLVARVEEANELSPSLATSHSPRRRALRVVADNRLRLSLDSDLVQRSNEFPTICLTASDVDKERVRELEDCGVTVFQSSKTEKEARLLDQLQYLSSEHSVTNLLCEGGGQLIGSLNDTEQLDQLEIYLGGKIFGGSGSVSPLIGNGVSRVEDATTWDMGRCQQYENDIHLTYFRKPPASAQA